MTHLSAFSLVCLGRMLFFLRCLSEMVESGLQQVGRHSTALSKQPAGRSSKPPFTHPAPPSLCLSVLAFSLWAQQQNYNTQGTQLNAADKLIPPRKLGLQSVVFQI